MKCDQLFSDLHRISLFKFGKKIWIFLTGYNKLLSYVHKKISPKINQDRFANNVFDPKNDFHEDRSSFPVYGSFLALFEAKIFAEIRSHELENWKV
jgi:hypothetical protein